MWGSGGSEPAASAPALCLLTLSPVLRKPFCQGQALSGVEGVSEAVFHLCKSLGRWRGGGMRPWSLKRKTYNVELREICRKEGKGFGLLDSSAFLPLTRNRSESG